MSSNASFPTPANVLRTEDMNGHFKKIFIEESGRPFHYFSSAGDEFAHDHPYSMTSHVVIGGYVEEVYTIEQGGKWSMQLYERLPGTSHRIQARHVHRIVRLLGDHCLTHIEPGPPEIAWSFYRFDEEGAWRRFPEDDTWKKCFWTT